jgi:hypothetical protein
MLSEKVATTVDHRLLGLFARVVSMQVKIAALFAPIQ